MVRVSVVGSGGYAGFILIQCLLRHPFVELMHLAVRGQSGIALSEIHPFFLNRCDKKCSSIEDIESIVRDSDLIFFVLPHKVTMTLLPQFLFKDLIIIDLSGDYRLQNEDDYRQFYGQKHESFDLTKTFVYGLSEIFSKKISQSQRISNPGCFPTAVQLGLAPLLRRNVIEMDSIFVDAKTGLSGAGKTLRKDLHFCEANENVKAYKVAHHQHQPEMEQISSQLAQRSVQILFVPHLIPMNRGIYSTTHVRLCRKVTDDDLYDFFKEDYKEKSFVRILPEGHYPEIKNVLHTNFCDLSLVKRGQNLLIFSALDNLMKGASSQAIQNMNIVLGFKETEGLL